MKLDEKVSLLKRRLRELESAVVAFSGGVDSAVLTCLAHEMLADRMCAATTVTPSTPARDQAAAEKFCQERGIVHVLCITSEFENPQFITNPEDRCYFCKSALYERLKEIADQKGFRFVVEGTNASDLEGHRPGYRASCEKPFVVTPLIDCGFTKEDVRKSARQLKLHVADKPASACLASRIPTGVKIEPAVLKIVDQAEETIRSFGLKQVRVRHHNDLARIEVGPEETAQCLKYSEEISRCLKQLGYKFVTLDLRGYKSRPPAGGHEILR